ncbi:forkhead-associated (FHA) domain-containing protein [Striga asiatica]|uniref:Forkhead-associated (FHA) domain-containing protein n=1 Tax=Striga asiatica TaxID=4170 RepID=A0A5A7P3Z7_STRAF|nr:forkhead-associated (FHA) domain-containing protein [Striga asiatica]
MTHPTVLRLNSNSHRNPSPSISRTQNILKNPNNTQTPLILCATMAEDQELPKPKEREIPVFTVLKNNCILKNIFLLDNPPSISAPENVRRESEMEDILVVGRHPDCNIKLEHPSVSRFHLRIHSNPDSRSLHVTDLSSVHGTWISGKKVEPGVMVKLNEGDTLQIGASSRLYRLDWVPISRAYDINDPFVSQLDKASGVPEEEPDKATDQDHNTLFDGSDHVETMGDHLEGLERLFSIPNEDFCSSVRKTSPVLPLVYEDLHDSVPTEDLEKYSLPELFIQENDICISQPCQFEQENGTPVMNSKKKSGIINIWSRRSKPESVGIETSQFRAKSSRINTSLQMEKSFIDENQNNESLPMYVDDEKESFTTPEKENAFPHSHLFSDSKSKKGEILKSGLVLSMPVSIVDLDEEIFTPDKENMTPGSRVIRSMKNIAGKNPSSSHRSSPLKKAYNSNMYQEEASQCKKVFREWRSTSSGFKSHGSSKKELALSKCGAYREPFCPLPLESPGDHKSKSKPSVCEHNITRGSIDIKCPEPEENNTTKVPKIKWVIVVDTACLLDKNSRKELHLLRGLRGTNLVIPRIVVRELDCMLRRGDFFTRTSEVYAALQFIEESMEVAKWWIHVQSSTEEVGLLPPTPPASSSSPHWFGEDKWANSIGSSTPFFPCSLMQEIVTPTAGDHILDYALCCRRVRKDGQLVLLSNDVTLKIKAMAEGVLCETAQEFRRSLVNPFSARFLYADCSPIGPTWSCEDDIVLKEKYYPSPSKKVTRSSAGGGVKGLKLILMHNSSFRQITHVS